MIVFIPLILVQLCASESLEEVPIQPRACDGSCDYYQNLNNCAEGIHCVDPEGLVVPPCNEGECFDDGPACGCAPERGCPDNCQYYQTEEQCPKYQNCDHLEAIGECAAGQCFSELYCSCTSDPVPPVPCTTGCNVRAAEHPDGCLGYRYCDTEVLYRCPDGLCFDESICGCSEDATPNPPGTPAPPSPDCPCAWLLIPNEDCNQYVDCLKPDHTMSCSEGCFSEEVCSCVDGPSTPGPTTLSSPGPTPSSSPGPTPPSSPGPTPPSSPGPTTTTTTSGPPNCDNCSFMPVGPSSCSSYAPCPNGSPIYNCNPGLCFNEASCSCESQQQVVCEPGCAYGPGSPTDCQWYTHCTTGESFVCPGITCFQPTQCTCA